jgi:nicotinamidase-related amidase
LTKNYSIIAPEVLTTPDGRAIAEVNVNFLEALSQSDVVIIAGQAKSHCVAWSIEHLLRVIQAKDPKLADKVYLLGDCSSPVVVKDSQGNVIYDYAPEAEAAYRRFADAGMHLVNSTDNISDWSAFQ